MHQEISRSALSRPSLVPAAPVPHFPQTPLRLLSPQTPADQPGTSAGAAPRTPCRHASLPLQGGRRSAAASASAPEGVRGPSHDLESPPRRRLEPRRRPSPDCAPLPRAPVRRRGPPPARVPPPRRPAAEALRSRACPPSPGVPPFCFYTPNLWFLSRGCGESGRSRRLGARHATVKAGCPTVLSFDATSILLSRLSPEYVVEPPLNPFT